MRNNLDFGKDMIKVYEGNRDLTTGFDKSERPFVADQHVKRKGTYYSPAILNLIAEGGRTFFRFLDSLGLAGESNLIVLSSKHHYYYDENDLKSVRIVVSLKKLNSIKYLDSFLYSLFRILPAEASFVGCFSDARTSKTNGGQLKWFRIFNYRLRNFLDSTTDHMLDERKVSGLLEKNGLKMVSVIRINGITYFYSKRNAYEEIGKKSA